MEKINKTKQNFYKNKKLNIRLRQTLITNAAQDIKVGLSPSNKNYFICFNDSLSKMMKNVFISS